MIAACMTNVIGYQLCSDGGGLTIEIFHLIKRRYLLERLRSSNHTKCAAAVLSGQVFACSTALNDPRVYEAKTLHHNNSMRAEPISFTLAALGPTR